MSAHEPALCALPACPECDAYGLGYTHGKAKLADEVRWTLRDKRGHAAGCGCAPCVLIADVLEAALAVSVRPAVLDADGHTRDCAGPGCGATCGCPCHVGERP